MATKTRTYGLVEGTWYNELGSHMILHQKDSKLTGTYVSAVGNGKFENFDLDGQIDTKADPKGQAIGWVVVWNNGTYDSQSVTSWSGQYHNTDGKEEISTLWVLTTELLPDMDWKSHNVNQDVFSRDPPSPAVVAVASKRKARSHPPSIC